MKTLCFAVGLAAIVTAGSTMAEETMTECYDAVVYAKAVRQLPTRIPTCDNCVVMRWPWFVDLHVKRGIEGDARKGNLTVLALQHSKNYRPKYFNWWLRRNAAGGFNVVAREQDRNLPRCAAGAEPIRPLIRPANDETLEDIYERLADREKQAASKD